MLSWAQQVRARISVNNSSLSLSTDTKGRMQNLGRKEAFWSEDWQISEGMTFHTELYIRLIPRDAHQTGVPLEKCYIPINSNILATWCKELTHLKRPWCWERLRAGGEGDDRGWDSWMASSTRWTWVCVSSGSWWWTGRPGVLQSMGSQRVRHDWATDLNC